MSHPRRPVLPAVILRGRWPVALLAIPDGSVIQRGGSFGGHAPSPYLYFGEGENHSAHDCEPVVRKEQVDQPLAIRELVETSVIIQSLEVKVHLK